MGLPMTRLHDSQTRRYLEDVYDIAIVGRWSGRGEAEANFSLWPFRCLTFVTIRLLYW